MRPQLDILDVAGYTSFAIALLGLLAEPTRDVILTFLLPII